MEISQEMIFMRRIVSEIPADVSSSLTMECETRGKTLLIQEFGVICANSVTAQNDCDYNTAEVERQRKRNSHARISRLCVAA
jgi:hypothetical protein